MYRFSSSLTSFKLSRAQGDYIGRGTAVRAGGAQDYGGNSRGMLGGNYGANRAEAELVAQYGGAGGGRSAAADPRLSAGSGAGYVSNQQASVYGGMSGGRGPGGGTASAHNYHSCLLCNPIICFCLHITLASKFPVLFL